MHFLFKNPILVEVVEIWNEGKEFFLLAEGEMNE